MRTLTATLVFLMLAALSAGHVNTRPATTAADPAPAYVLMGGIPVSAPAGAEFLLLVR
jgi:hypothetical protein